MTKTNAKSIRASDLFTLYDALYVHFSKCPEEIPEGFEVADHVTGLMSNKLKSIGYERADQLDKILSGHKSKRDKSAEPVVTGAVNGTVEALYADITGKPFEQAPGNSPLPKAEAKAANPTPTPAKNDAKAARSTGGFFEIEDESEIAVINTALENATNKAACDFAHIVAEMVGVEAALEAAHTSNTSIDAVISAYRAGEVDVDETEIKEIPKLDPSGYADLDTSNPMIGVVDNLVSRNVKGAIPLSEIVARIKAAEAGLTEAKSQERKLMRDLRRARPKTARKVQTETAQISQDISEAEELNADVSVVEQMAADIFPGVYGANLTILNFEVPTLDFGADHPEVPAKDDTFRFFLPVLAEALNCIADNELMWLHGESGCGKTMFWEQVAARLNMPFTRMNFDGHLTRSDIVGTNRLMPGPNGQPEMRFIEGILPRAMRSPGILLLDEFDLGDPEIMPIFQPVLEGQPLRLLEDSGRVVRPHPLFRIALTGNSIGLGSENQLYNNVFEQSAATRDRISAYVEMPYLDPKVEKEVVLARQPNADVNFVERLIQLANEVRDGFRQGEIHQLFSTRAVQACARRYTRFEALYPTAEQAVDAVLDNVILGRLDSASRNVVKGLKDNIFA